MKTTAFRVKDLMINVLPSKVSGGSTSLPGPDDDVTDIPTPITPIVSVAAQFQKLRIVSKIGLERLTVEGLNAAALDVGRVAVSSMFQCTEDMPTCDANERISPFATPGAALRLEDLAIAKEFLSEALASIDHIEQGRLRQAQSEVEQVGPLLEEALSALHGKS